MKRRSLRRCVSSSQLTSGTRCRKLLRLPPTLPDPVYVRQLVTSLRIVAASWRLSHHRPGVSSGAVYPSSLTKHSVTCSLSALCVCLVPLLQQGYLYSRTDTRVRLILHISLSIDTLRSWLPSNHQGHVWPECRSSPAEVPITLLGLADQPGCWAQLGLGV